MSGIPPERIVPIDKTNTTPSGVPRVSVTDLIAEGMKRDPNFVERRLAPGEAKTKTALYCFSSGTTGKPKVSLSLACLLHQLLILMSQAVIMSHYALIANVLLATAATKSNDDSIEWNERLYRPGNVTLGGSNLLTLAQDLITDEMIA